MAPALRGAAVTGMARGTALALALLLGFLVQGVAVAPPATAPGATEQQLCWDTPVGTPQPLLLPPPTLTLTASRNL